MNAKRYKALVDLVGTVTTRALDCDDTATRRRVLSGTTTIQSLLKTWDMELAVRHVWRRAGARQAFAWCERQAQSLSGALDEYYDAVIPPYDAEAGVKPCPRSHKT